MPYIKLGMLSEFQVPLPPITIQQAIVAEIEAEQALVAANRERIARFEKKIQASLARVCGEDEPTPNVGATHASPLQGTSPLLMKYNPECHHRRSIRLKGYDYSQAGAYFVTIVTKDQVCLFGEVVGEGMRLNEYGVIADHVWLAIPDHFLSVELDDYIIMPNHIHGIIVITETVGATHASSLQNMSPLQNMSSMPGPQPQSVSSIVGSLKSAVTKRINEIRQTFGTPIWQRNYYEQIIRDEESLQRIRQYILDNPAQWAFDKENPAAIQREVNRPTFL
jgi:REP element-mobilizing transposase RayT